MFPLEKEEEELELNLEKQFEMNLEYKLKGGARRHKGLGFHDEGKNEEKEIRAEGKESTDTENKDGEETTVDEYLRSKRSGEICEKEKQEDIEKDKISAGECKIPDSSKKYATSFVKASS